MAQTRTSNDSIPNFTLIAPSIWEHVPASFHQSPNAAPKDSEAPSLIILCTWTGAQNRYIAKYTAQYQSLFPSTRIMVVTTTAKDLCFRSSIQKQERCRPAVERIWSNLDANGHILLHVFSEGGSNKACELAEAYYNLTGARLPVSATCFDSTPGHPRFLRLCNALNKSLPQIPVVKHTGLLFGTVVLGAFWLTYTHVKGQENNVISKTRRRINDPAHFDLHAPRCYLYSKQDVLISWEDIDQHVAESVFTGVPVRDVLFEGSGHCEHAKYEPKRYWEAVMTTWKDANQLNEKPLPGFQFIVQQPEFDIMKPELGNSVWRDADSERTLLPGGSSCAPSIKA